MKCIYVILFAILYNGNAQLRPPFSEMVSLIETLLALQGGNDSNQIVVELYLCKTDERLNLTDSNLSKIDKSNPVVFIIHGWTETSTRQWYQTMIEAFNKQGNYNVIAVDWSLPAKKRYFISSKNTRKVGEIIGDFIIKLNQEQGVPLSNFHVVGHSLGGQTAGFVGKRVVKKTGTKINRITALDPAGPLFDDQRLKEDDHLWKTDAEVVDVIHTDGGYFGMASPCGTIDFYPNGGTNLQPGCSELQFPFDIQEGVFCSHTRSIKFYTESINSKGMVGRKCDSWASFQKGLCKNSESNIMGEHTYPNQTGTFFLVTNNKSPFAKSD